MPHVCLRQRTRLSALFFHTLSWACSGKTKYTHTHTHTHTHTLTLSHTHTHTHPLTHTHTHTHTLSLSHTHTHTLSHTLSHTHSLTHTHTLSLSHSHTHTHTHTLSLSHTHSLTHTLTHTHTHSLTHSHTHTLSLSLTHTHTNTHSLTHSHTHTHTHSLTHTHYDLVSKLFLSLCFSLTASIDPTPKIDGQQTSSITVQENVTHHFSCQSEGWDAQAPPLLTWYLNGERQSEVTGRRLVMTSSQDSRVLRFGSERNSTFTLKPKRGDRELVCTARNPARGESYNASVTLNVQCESPRTHHSCILICIIILLLMIRILHIII